jgi:hypothetical protein
MEAKRVEVKFWKVRTEVLRALVRGRVASLRLVIDRAQQR